MKRVRTAHVDFVVGLSRWKGIPERGGGAGLVARRRWLTRCAIAAKTLPTATLVWLRLSMLRRKARPSVTTVIVERPGVVPAPVTGPTWLVAPVVEQRISELRTVVQRLRESVAVGRRRSTAVTALFVDRIVERARTVVVTVPDRSARSGAEPSVVPAASPTRGGDAAVAALPVQSRPALAGAIGGQHPGPVARPASPVAPPALAAALRSVVRRPAPAAETPAPSMPAVATRPLLSDGVTLLVRTLTGSSSAGARLRASPLTLLPGVPSLPARLPSTTTAPVVTAGRRLRVGPVAAALPTFMPLTGATPAPQRASRPRLATTVALERPTSVGPAPLAAPRPPRSATTAIFAATTAPLPLAARLPVGPLAAPDALPFLRRREKTVDVHQLQETVTRRIEETLHRRVIQDVESVVARELSPDSVLARRLGDRLYTGLVESLVLEKERLEWG